VRGNSLVVAISATGAVEATLEAAEVARRSGAEVLGVTAEAEGALATRFPSLLVAPPVAADDVAGQGARLLGNFLFSLAGLQLLAAHAARGWGQALEPAVDDAFEDLPDLVEAAVDHAGAVGAYLGDAREDADFYFLGAGPSYGAALFYQAKFFEQARRPVFGAQLEEFAHEQIFLLRPEADAHVWFIAPRGRSRDRAVKIMAGCRELGARVTAVTTTADAALDEVAQLVVPLGELPEVVSPSVTVMPGQLLGLHAFARWGRGERFASRRAQQMSVAHGLTRSRN
jgi:fructoselysine-6-P-deglycase FrlB-like protein